MNRSHLTEVLLNLISFFKLKFFCFRSFYHRFFNLNSEQRFQLSLNDRDLIENMYKYYKLQVQILLWGHGK